MLTTDSMMPKSRFCLQIGNIIKEEEISEYLTFLSSSFNTIVIVIIDTFNYDNIKLSNEILEKLSSNRMNVSAGIKSDIGKLIIVWECMC